MPNSIFGTIQLRTQVPKSSSQEHKLSIPLNTVQPYIWVNGCEHTGRCEGLLAGAQKSGTSERETAYILQAAVLATTGLYLKSVWTWSIQVQVRGEELLSEPGPTAWINLFSVQTLSPEWIRSLSCDNPNNLLVQKEGSSRLAWLGLHSQMSSQETILHT